MKILGFGYCPVDYYHYEKKTMSLTELGTPLFKDGGGSTANTLCFLSSFYNCDTYMIGNVGDDDDAHFVQSTLKQYGVSTKHVHCVSGKKTQKCHCIVNKGERNFISEPSGVGFPTLEQMKKQKFESDFSVFLTEYGEYASRYVSQFARYVCYNGQMPFIKWKYEEEMAFIFQSEIVFFSEIYLKNLLCTKMITKEHLFQFAKVPLIILGKGEKGIMAIYRGNFFSVPAKPVEVVDTTGAGDIFLGSLIYLYFQEKEKNLATIQNIIKKSIIHASNSCTYKGARRYIQSIKEKGQE